MIDPTTNRAEFKAYLDEHFLKLAFDQVRLETRYSEILPEDTNLESRFSQNVGLKIPFVSAAMDTVTEGNFARAIAMKGGLGIIHKNLTPAQQAVEVARVKRHLNGYIAKPQTVLEGATVQEILRMKEDHGYGFNTFPVLDSNGKLTGILTSNSFKFCDDHSLTAKEIMETDVLSRDDKMTISDAYELMMDERLGAIPIVNEAGGISGMYTFKDVARIHRKSNETYNVDDNGQLLVGAAIGVKDKDFERLEALVDAGVDVVVIDTAHGDSKGVFEMAKRALREYGSRVDIVAGNISSGRAARRMVELGVHGIKVGQGGGSICTTRIVAGIGVPQFGAVLDCAAAIEGSDVPICADGGIRYSGDVVIALAEGAESVMGGSIFAGTKETPGKVISYKGQSWKMYRGMGSLGAMTDNQGSRDRYNQTDAKNLVPEGIEGLKPFRGDLGPIVDELSGGVQAGLGYNGAKNIIALQDGALFFRMEEAGIRESHPHDVDAIKEGTTYAGGS